MSNDSAKQPQQHPNDRRKSLAEDRRDKGRQGKFDRRKNRCQACKHFEPIDSKDGWGDCQIHHVQVANEMFACLEFEAI